MKISVKIFITVILALNLTGCNNDKIYQDEPYKNLVYLLSSTDNIFVASYTLNETESERYVTVGCGGANTNDKDVEIKLESAPEWMNRYNLLNFNYEHQYAKLLPAKKYDISSYTITLPSNSDYHYQRLPVKVRPLGLSPDSIYFIPLKIVSVSDYEVNEDKQYILYRVTIENDYATQIPQTYYRKDGSLLNPYTVLSGVKLVQPLTKNRVRMFIGNESFSDATTPAFIDRNSVVVQINEDNTVTVFPYDETMMEVEMLENEEKLDYFNVYDPEYMRGVTKQRVMWLNYRFRQRPASGVGDFGAWRIVDERLTRVEAN